MKPFRLDARLWRTLLALTTASVLLATSAARAQTAAPASEAKPSPSSEAKPSPSSEAKPSPPSEAKPSPPSEAKPAQPAEAKQSPPPEGTVRGLRQVASVEGITAYELGNGMQLLLVPDASKPTTTVNLTLRVGSRHESYGETGMAHLLEHLVFKGTPTHKNVWAEFAKRGLRANGSTWYDRTNYFASFNASDDNLRWYVGWLADAMINSFIARADLDTEMTVVRNEMESGENDPQRILMQRVIASMYEWHNYGKETIGARSDVENVDIARLQAFYRRHYQPDNATLIVSGRFDAAMVRDLVAQAFGTLAKPQRTLNATYTIEPVQDGERIVTLRRTGGTPQVMMAYHVPPGSHPDFGALALLAQVLTDAPAGRLHKRLVDAKLAAGVFSWPAALAEPGFVLMGAQLGPGQSAERARDVMAKTLDGLRAEPVTAAELERARSQWLNAWERDFNDPQKVGVELSESIALGDWRLYFLKRDHVRKATLADVNRVAAERLRADNRTVGVYLPTAQPQRAPAPARVDVAALVKDYKGDASVAQAEAFDATPANLESRTQRSLVGWPPGGGKASPPPPKGGEEARERPVASSAGGMRVALLPKGTRGRAVHARIALHVGDEKSLFGQSTVASMAGANLSMGGAGMTRQQINDAWEKLRAQVSFGADDQTVHVDIETVKENLPDVIRLAGRLLREPAYPPAGLDENKRQWLAAIEAQRKEPDALVTNAIQRHGNPYPRGDIRYAPTFDELEQTIKGITGPQLKSFHQRFYAAADADFAAVGDMDVAAVKQAVEQAFGNWRKPAVGSQAYARVPQPLILPPPARLLLSTPDKQNANLKAYVPLPVSDRDADYVALMAANYILGGNTNSRLWMRIRETEGLSYDVRSSIGWSPWEANSGWTSTAIFAPQNRAKVEAAWRQEIDRSVKEGYTQAELDEAKNGLLNRRRLSRAQDEETASTLRSQLELGRTFEVSRQVDDKIQALTLDEVNAAWRKHFDPAKLVVAWGGDFKGE
jgi:zinc protease